MPLRILTGKSTRKILLGRHRHKWEVNIGMYLKEIGVSTRNLVDSAQDRNYCRAIADVILNLLVS